ncbi:hypothetical protein FSP39_010639 [Pinctada imbricata]|uniref:Uncharacterized protein n=1 Tax=Pinctada imbricata TaxID=66713 RepID=A0AA88XVW6_PINIB|nr:hypothetical protein FSP39_010639 [Pinctada imbricata]
MAEWCRTYLGFHWQGKFFVFTVLPFGLTSAPYVFTKCLRPMVKYWRSEGVNIVLYLDDGWCINDTYDKSLADVCFVYQSLTDAGFLVNREKSIFDPTQCLTWLGLVWDSLDFSLCIPDQRILDLLLNIEGVLQDRLSVSARMLAQVSGRIISMSPVIGNVSRIMTRSLYRCIEARQSWDHIFPLIDQTVMDELSFWRSNIRSLNVRKLCQYEVPIVVFSDASSYACGAYCESKEGDVFHKMWTGVESRMSSTWREAKAIEFFLDHFKDSFSGKTVKCFTDSKCCVSVISIGSSKFHLQRISLAIFEICRQKSITLDMQWIPRSLNTPADELSKVFDFDDWGVSVQFFKFIDSIYGPHTVDRFADSNNTKLPIFCSKFFTTGTSGVDAFSMNWGGHNNWLVPPIYLASKVIKHCVASSAEGNIEYSCPANSDCEITKRRRKACQACRFQKCLGVGMLREGVRLDRVRGGRQKYKRSPDSQLIVQQIFPMIKKACVEGVIENKILSQLLSIETQLDKLYVSTDQDTDEDDLRFLATVSDLADRELVITISWAKQVPGFCTLSLIDQMNLLQHSWLEILCLNLVFRSCPYNGYLKFAEDLQLSVEDAKMCQCSPELDSLSRKLAKKFTNMGVTKEEYLLLKAMTLCNTDILIENNEAVMQLQDKLQDGLIEYVKSRYAGNLRRLGHLYLLLPSLNQMKLLAKQYWFDIKKDGRVMMHKLFLEMLEADS